jgi:hypothetical protein
LCLYFSWKLLRFIHFYFREYYTLWNIAMGGTSGRRAGSAKMRLQVYICKTELLDEVSVNELYSFLIKMLNTEVTIKHFHHSVLLSYKYAIMAREKKDGSLRGVTLLGVDRKELNGVKFTLIRLGLSFFENYYRGGPLLYYVFAYHIMKEMILHPLTPLFVIGKAFSYKSYLILCKTISRAYPKYNTETTDFARSLLNNYGMSVKFPGEEYDPETFVLKREKTAIKKGVAVLQPDDLKDPHIKFFVDRNPGWVKGHQLLSTGEIRWIDFFNVLRRSVGRAIRGRRGEGTRPRKQKTFDRRYSFQSEMATRYATVYSEMDIGGDKTDHHVTYHKTEADKEVESESEVSPPRVQRALSNINSYDIYEDL